MTPAGWGVLLPGADATAAVEVPRAAAAAEALGFDVVWAADDLVGPDVDAPVCLAAAAAATSRIGLGLGLAGGRRAPAWSAKHLTAVDALAPGRVRLGIDLFPGPADTLTDGEEILALARGGPLPTTDPERPPAALAPTLAATPPIAYGGSGEAALRRAAALADAWVAADLEPGALTRATAALGESARKLDRPPPRPVVIVRIAEAPATGTALDRIVGAVEQISAYTAAGAETFLLAATGPDPLADYARFAELRGRVAAELPA